MNKIVKNKKQDEALAQILRAMAHPVRLRMLRSLCHKDYNVKGLLKEIKICQPLASQHLARLQKVGLIIRERRGKETTNRIADKKIENLLNEICQFTQNRKAA